MAPRIVIIFDRDISSFIIMYFFRRHTEKVNWYNKLKFYLTCLELPGKKIIWINGEIMKLSRLSF